MDYRDSHQDPSKGRQYDDHYATDSWSAFQWEREQQVLDAILQRWDPHAPISLLDFACGTGRIVGYLESKVSYSTGVDVSEPMLAEARRRLRRTRLIDGDITREDVLRGETFNLITAFRFFANAQPDLRAEAMQALAERLAPDGLLVLNNHHNLGSPYMRLLRMHLRGRVAGFRFLAPKEMRRLVDDAGLRVVDTYGVGFLHVPRVRIPRPALRIVENRLSRIQWLSRYADDLILVCKHEQP